MKYKKLITNRILITILLLVIQATWLVIFLMELTNYSTVISGIFNTLSILIVLYIIGKDENSAYRIGWILLIMTFPLFGGLFYLFFGNKTPSKKLKSKLDSSHKKIKKLLIQNDDVISDIGETDARVCGTVNYIYKNSDNPAWENTHSAYFPNGEQMYQAMLTEIKNARHFIFLEFFIIEEGIMWNQILDILTEKAAQGVDIRLIYDDMGCLTLLPGDYFKELEKKGIKTIAFNPFRPFLSLVMNNRDHRKLLIVDGHTAFNGGINLADEYINAKVKYGYWKDNGIMLKGNAVSNFTLMFLEMWNAFRAEDLNFEKFMPNRYLQAHSERDGFVQPFSDSPLDNEPVGERVYIDILNQAKDYVYIYTPYLIISDEMKQALCLAAKRGVDVRIITPGIPDKPIIFRLTRSNYKPLLDSNVKIYEYTPGFMHAKTYLSDDRLAVVGTINMDYRSLYLHFECGTFLYENAMLSDILNDFKDTLSQCKQIKYSDLKTTGPGKLFDALLRLFSPLF